MRFIKCGSKLFDPYSVTAVHLNHVGGGAGPTEVWVVVPGDALIFRGKEAEAVRAYFGRMPATDLMQRDEGEATGVFGERIPARDEAPEAVAPNHSQWEC